MECQNLLHNYLLGPTFRRHHLSTKIDDIVGQKRLFSQHDLEQIVHHIRIVLAHSYLDYFCIEHCYFSDWNYIARIHQYMSVHNPSYKGH